MADTLITPAVRALIGQETPPERNRFPISEAMVCELTDATEFPLTAISLEDFGS